MTMEYTAFYAFSFLRRCQTNAKNKYFYPRGTRALLSPWSSAAEPHVRALEKRTPERSEIVRHKADWTLVTRLARSRTPRTAGRGWPARGWLRESAARVAGGAEGGLGRFRSFLLVLCCR